MDQAIAKDAMDAEASCVVGIIIITPTMMIMLFLMLFLLPFMTTMTVMFVTVRR